jgi:hypothetical protein
MLVLGLKQTLTVKFTNVGVLPVASTCALQLTIPTAHSHNREEFYEKMNLGFQSHDFLG